MTCDARLGRNLEGDSGCGGLGVPDGLCAGLDVRVDAVVVARGEGGEVAEAVEGDSVLGGAETSSSGVTGHLALLDIVGRLSTKEEAVTAEDGVSSEGGSLASGRIRTSAWAPESGEIL